MAFFVISRERQGGGVVSIQHPTPLEGSGEWKADGLSGKTPKAGKLRLCPGKQFVR